jgi:hypothetical protein
MRHTVRFTGVIIFAIVVLMVVSSPHRPAHAATPAKKKDAQTYHLVFDRPSREGYRSESTGEIRAVTEVRGVASGVYDGDLDDYLEAKYDVIEKVNKVDPHGRPSELRVYFKSLKFRTDKASTLDNAECTGKPITVAEWPDLSITRDDGEDIIPDEMEVLKHLYEKSDPDEPTADDLFGPDRDVTIGDAWKPSSQTLAKRQQDKGLLVPDNGVSAITTLSGRKRVDGQECLLVDMTVTCPNIDGDSSLPADFRSIHGSFKNSVEWVLPIDSEAHLVGESETATSNYTASLYKDGNLPVDVTAKKTVFTSETFVKEL